MYPQSDQAGKLGLHEEENKKETDQPSSSGQACSKTCAKAFQNLYTLLGFNENERRFTTMPYRIR